MTMTGAGNGNLCAACEATSAACAARRWLGGRACCAGCRHAEPEAVAVGRRCPDCVEPSRDQRPTARDGRCRECWLALRPAPEPSRRASK